MNSIGSERITLRGTPGERQRTVLLTSVPPPTKMESTSESKKSKLPLFLALFAVLVVVVFVIYWMNSETSKKAVQAQIAPTEIRAIQVTQSVPDNPIINKLSLTEFNDLNKRIKDSESYSEIAEKYYLRGDYDNALIQYKLALEDFMQIIDYFEKTLGPNHESSVVTYKNIATTYNNLGEVCRSYKKYDEALEWLMKAMQINERTVGANHQSTGNIYNNIALVYDSKGQYKKALEWYHKTLSISEQFSNEHAGPAKTYNNIGMVHFHLGDRPLAMEWFKKALAIQESVDMESPETAITRNNIAEIYRVQGDYVLALPEYLRAYRILRKKFGERNPSTKAVRENLARAYDKSDNPKSFVEWLEDSLL